MRRKAFVTVLAVGGLLLAGQVAFAYSIPEDTSIGTWDAKTRTYTLTTDVVFGAVVIQDQEDLTLDGAGHAIHGYAGTVLAIADSVGITVRNVNVSAEISASNGVYIGRSDFCTVETSTISNPGWGIAGQDSNFCTIAGNTFDGCLSAILIATDLHNARCGGWSIVDNLFVDSGFWGLILQYFDYGRVTGNTISNPGYGGLALQGSYNRVYNNNFIANSWHIGASGTGNVFSLPWPIGGNHWSGWTGPDADGDGIVDSPYTFAGGQDDLPWTTPDGWLALGPADLILALAAWVDSLDLPAGLSNSLDAKLQAAFSVLEDANPKNDGAAANSLQAFINALEAQRGKKINAADADMLITVAEVIIARLGE